VYETKQMIYNTREKPICNATGRGTQAWP